jgi:leucyl-tRNA synthetase
MDRLRFNTMISALMEYSNYIAKIREAGSVSVENYRSAVRTLLSLLAPTAPHFAEEVWSKLGYEYSIHNQPWPEWSEKLAENREIPLVVQVNGKVRERLIVSADITEEEARRYALESPKVKAYTEGKAVMQVIYVPFKLVNVVVK